MQSQSIEAGLKEGDFAVALGAIQRRFPDVVMGSYPRFDPGAGFTTTLVLRSRSRERLRVAEAAVSEMLESVRAGLKG